MEHGENRLDYAGVRARTHMEPTWNLIGSHQVGLPTALKFGRRLGWDLPDQVDILACEAADLSTLSEQLSPAVEKAVGLAAERARGWI